METIAREQTIIRFRKEVMERAKYKAKQQGKSLNAFLEEIVGAAVMPRIPKLPDDFQIDPAIERFSGIMPEPTKEQLEADDRLAYILGKGMPR